MKPKPIRVAILCYRDAAIAGGSLRVGEVIANNLNRARVEAHLVFAYGGPGPVMRRSSVSCHYLEGNGPRDIKAWTRARKTMQSIKPDVIHFMDNIVWLQAALLGSGYKRIVHVHGPLLPSDIRRSTKRIWGLTKRVAQHIVCISHDAQNNLVRLGFAQPEKISVVYNSIDCRQFDRAIDDVEARIKVGLPADALLLGMVCRLVPNKGCADFLTLIHRLPAQWHGVLCGDGPQRAELESRCRELDLIGRVHFLGVQDDVVPVYATLDAYAFLSRYEPFGLMIAEAMAAHVPVFGFGGDGEYRESPHCLVTPETAALVEYHREYASNSPANEEPLNQVASLLNDYANHPERYREMIERAGAWVRRCFDAPLQAEAMSRVYEYVCESERREVPQLSCLYEAVRSRALAEMSTNLLAKQEARAGC